MPRPDDAEPMEPPRDSVPWLFHHAEVRTYVVAGLAALAMLFMFLFQEGGPVGAALLTVIGIAGLILRWPAAPGLVLLVLGWFLLFPFGVPDAYERRWEIDEAHFRVMDLVLVAAAVVYIACQYRVLALAQQSMPPEAGMRRRGEKPARRPPGLVRRGEFIRLLYLVAGTVIVGQLVWWVATSIEVDAGESIPFRWADTSRSLSSRREPIPPGARSPEATRFMALAGFVIFTALLGRLVFGYWRLRAMGPAEAALVVQDAGWNEARREPDRIEKWRAAARKRAQRAAGPKPEGRA